MIAIKTVDLRDFKKVADYVMQGEKVLISRPRNENIVMITEKEYNELDKLRKKNGRAELLTTIRALQKSATDSVADEMTIDEIEAEIATYRRKKQK
jgi:antitoxin YefM